MITDNRPIIEKESYDVIVVGGGIAGIASSVAAARHGAKVLLLEKSITLGGLATIGLISCYEPLCDYQGKQMVFGIAEELIKLCIQDGFDNLPQDWKDKTEPHTGAYTTMYSPTAFAMVLDEYLKENGVTVRFDSYATFPVMDGNICTGIMVESISGREFYSAKAVIDCTGDASISDRAGIPTVVGKNYLVGMAHYTNRSRAKQYADGGDLNDFRYWLYAVNETGKPNLKIHEGVTAEGITDFVIKCRAGILAKARQEENEEREVLTLPTMPLYRTIRHIIGKHVYSAIPDKRYPDSIGNCGDWQKYGIHYNVPYTCLYNQDFPNIWTAGRIVSTDEARGWEILRIIPNCALTGQAAGTAAATCIKKGYTNDNIPIEELQQLLVADGVVID